MRKRRSATAPRLESLGKRSNNSMLFNLNPKVVLEWTVLLATMSCKGSKNRFSSIRRCNIGMRASNSSCTAEFAWKDLAILARRSDMRSHCSWGSVKLRPMLGSWRSIEACAGSGTIWRNTACMSSFTCSTSGGRVLVAVTARRASNFKRALVSFVMRSVCEGSAINLSWKSSSKSSSTRAPVCCNTASCNSFLSRIDLSWLAYAGVWNSESSARTDACSNTVLSSRLGNAAAHATPPKARVARTAMARSAITLSEGVSLGQDKVQC
mmetsp:Transcript_79574/g.177985  ORF Transcript_79574/g.177985 Transcript_79574/m.177985 type:complete len:267 (-) Transcript_79574:30-830(-)